MPEKAVKNWKCGHCPKKYVSLGHWYQKHHNKHHDGERMKATRITTFAFKG